MHLKYILYSSHSNLSTGFHLSFRIHCNFSGFPLKLIFWGMDPWIDPFIQGLKIRSFLTSFTIWFFVNKFDPSFKLDDSFNEVFLPTNILNDIRYIRKICWFFSVEWIIHNPRKIKGICFFYIFITFLLWVESVESRREVFSRFMFYLNCCLECNNFHEKKIIRRWGWKRKNK